MLQMIWMNTILNLNAKAGLMSGVSGTKLITAEPTSPRAVYKIVAIEDENGQMQKYHQAVLAQC